MYAKHEEILGGSILEGQTLTAFLSKHEGHGVNFSGGKKVYI